MDDRHWVRDLHAAFCATCSSVEWQASLLLLDNHGSHLSAEAIKFARDHGVVMSSFPPHCSHRLQPLDRSVYGPFKRFISVAQDSWMRNHPGKYMTIIYDFLSLVSEALRKSVTPTNISSGFRACGIVPFNRDIFTEAVTPSLPTDRTQPSCTQGQWFKHCVN